MWLSLGQGAFYANGARIDEETNLAEVALLHDRYLMLRKGKKSHHIVEVGPAS